MSTPPADVETRIRDACNARDYGMAMTWIVDGYGPELLSFLGSRLRRDDAAAAQSEQAAE